MRTTSRAAPTWREEIALQARGCRAIAGVDEAGRGPWAGPVVAAAVVLPDAWLPLERRSAVATLRTVPATAFRLVRDSKQLTPRQRQEACAFLTSAPGLSYGVGVGSARAIDLLGIVRATRSAMRAAIRALRRPPDALLVDYVDLSDMGLPCRSITHGDSLCISIAAASIIAKVTRDRLMVAIDQRYPGYGFAAHKGYGTPEHLARLRALGPCPIHRRSFRPVRDMALAAAVG